MIEILRGLVALVVGIIVVESLVYFFRQWFIDYVSPPDDSPDNHN